MDQTVMTEKVALFPEGEGRDRAAQQGVSDPCFDMPLVSVIIPVYNVAEYLPQCLDSVLAQTLGSFEALLIDDGSVDESPAICAAYAARDPRIRVLHKKNEGVSCTRNRGLALARGRYITLADSDDWLEPDQLETLARMLDDDPLIAVAVCGWFRHESGQVYDYGSNLPAGRISGREAFQWAVCGNGFEGYLWNKMYRREIFENGICFDEDITICEDLLLNCTLFAGGAQAAVIDRPLYHYRIRKGSALSSSKEKLRTEFAARDKILALAEGDPQLYTMAQYAYVKAKLSLAYRLFTEGEQKLADQTVRESRLHLAGALKSPAGSRAKRKLLLLSISPYRLLSAWLWIKRRFHLKPLTKHGRM